MARGQYAAAKHAGRLPAPEPRPPRGRWRRRHRCAPGSAHAGRRSRRPARGRPHAAHGPGPAARREQDFAEAVQGLSLARTLADLPEQGEGVPVAARRLLILSPAAGRARRDRSARWPHRCDRRCPAIRPGPAPDACPPPAGRPAAGKPAPGCPARELRWPGPRVRKTGPGTAGNSRRGPGPAHPQADQAEAVEGPGLAQLVPDLTEQGQRLLVIAGGLRVTALAPVARSQVAQGPGVADPVAGRPEQDQGPAEVAVSASA